MNDRVANFANHLAAAAAGSEDGEAVDGDPIGKCGVEGVPLGERNALIEPEEVVFFRVRLVLDYDSDVVELPAEFVRQEFEGIGNQLLESRVRSKDRIGSSCPGFGEPFGTA